MRRRSTNLREIAAGWQRVPVSEEQAAAIWPLVVATYSSIGMPLRGPEELADQPLWFVYARLSHATCRALGRIIR